MAIGAEHPAALVADSIACLGQGLLTNCLMCQLQVNCVKKSGSNDEADQALVCHLLQVPSRWKVDRADMVFMQSEAFIISTHSKLSMRLVSLRSVDSTHLAATTNIHYQPSF